MAAGKVSFDLASLKARALEAIDFRISQKLAEIDALDDDRTLEQQVDAWRSRIAEQVTAMYTRLPSDEALAVFTFDKIPQKDAPLLARCTRELRALEAERTRIEAKSGSLVADADGTISLTKSQLSEFFGL